MSDQLRIWVDADSCPKPVRSIIHRASERVRRTAVFIADRPLPDCRNGGYCEMVVVPSGDDRADDEIVTHIRPGDMAITRDVILASRIVERGCIALDDRGGVFTEENIKERLSLRNAMKDFREAGCFFERSNPLSARDIQQFANALDSQLTKLLRQEGSHS